MLHAIKQAFKPDRATVPVALQSHLADLRASEQTLQSRYADLALAAADGDANQSEADHAHAALMKHQQLIQRHLDLIQAAARRDERAGKDDARAALAQQFDNAQKAVERLAKAATHTESTLAAAVKAIHAQRQATADLHAALPGNFPHSMRDGLWTEADDLQVSVKGEFERLRLWHSSEPLHEWQPFALKYNHAVELLRQRAAAFLAKQP
jgi:hypothetical protein